jgi:hypothetical protein
MADPVFEAGQLWTLKPPADARTRIRVGAIEPFGEQMGVHVEVLHAPLPEGFTVDDPDAQTLSIGHIPITASALAASVDELEAEGTALTGPFGEAYAMWRIEALAGRGGYFGEPMPAVLEIVFEAIKQSQRPVLRGE